MNHVYVVNLTPEEITQLEELGRTKRVSKRKLQRAQILLAAHRGVSHEMISTTIGVGTATVYRTKMNFVQDGLERALTEAPRPGAQRKLDVGEESLLIALACSDAPAGASCWTLHLLADQMVGLTNHDSISDATIARRLDEVRIKPWQHKMWCIPNVDAAFVACMEDVLSLYAEPADPARPVVSFDETPRQLIGETRVPVRAAPGKPARSDYEYQRNGTANVFMFVDANRGWRHAKVTKRRTNFDFAHCMRDLVDQHYPDADRIRVVLDNLSTHSRAALYQTFEPAEARRILNKIEFHFTPKHASWLNMVEIEIGVLVKQCLAKRIPTIEILRAHVNAWQKRRNRDRATINWIFTVDQARVKMANAYPILTPQHDESTNQNH